MINVPHTLITEIVDRAFRQPAEPVERFRKFFAYWRENDAASLNASVDKAGVSLDDVCSGMPVPALKVITENPEPWKMVEDFLTNPMVLLRMQYAKKLAPETVENFRRAGFDRTLLEATTIDVHFSTQSLRDVNTSVLNLFGFIMVDSFWEGILEAYPGGPAMQRARFSHPDEFGDRIVLPFNDYVLVEKFARGLDEMVLSAHHRGAKNARESEYFARTLIGNCLLVEDMPTIAYDEVRRRYPRGLRDPLALAFQDGLTVDVGNGKYAYHPRVLMEALTGVIGDPKHLYFFRRAVGIKLGEVPPPDLEKRVTREYLEALKAEVGKIIPERDDDEVPCVMDIPLSNRRGSVDVDVTMFLPLLRHKHSKRLAGIKSLSNLSNLNLAYATQSRREHCIGVAHIAKAMCAEMGIKGYDLLKVMAYGMVHDWGHLTGSHPTELYFKAKCGFDHEEFAIDLVRKSADAFEGIVDPDDIVALFRQEDPLHDIIDGPFGADRIYFMTIDPTMCGIGGDYEPFGIINDQRWVGGQVVVDQKPEAAFRFLDYRAQLYDTLYFAPPTQISDAYLRKLLNKAGINSPFQKLLLKRHGQVNIAGDEGAELELCEFNDLMLYAYFANHPDREVSEPMRHLYSVYHKSPHATVAVLRQKGCEAAEPETEIPVYSKLVMCGIMPVVEGVDPEFLLHCNGALFKPENAAMLEGRIAEMIGIPDRHVIVASVPNLKKLAHEHAPVRVGSAVKSLFDWCPEYVQPFIDRAAKMSCLRVAVHPQLYPVAYDFFQRNSFRDIVKDALK